MKIPANVKVGGSVQRHFQFERNSKKIRLPVRVNPDDAKATFRNGLLIVRYDTARKGNPVPIR
jgi:HSP20 family molecular chaperone IbpA